MEKKTLYPIRYDTYYKHKWNLFFPARHKIEQNMKNEEINNKKKSDQPIIFRLDSDFLRKQVDLFQVQFKNVLASNSIASDLRGQ